MDGLDTNDEDGATPLDPNELGGLKFKHITKRGELDHLEQANIQQGLDWLARKKGIDILSEQFIKELHLKLFGEVWCWAGKFRTTERNIGIDPLQISVQLRLLLDDVKFWIENKTYPPLEIAARFHHRLVFIHPFPNGNGRHARIMTDILLTRILDHEPVNWSGGYNSQKMSEQRSNYIDALKSADQNDIQPLIDYIEKD